MDKNTPISPSGGTFSTKEIAFFADQGQGTSALSQAVNDISGISASFTRQGEQFKELADRAKAASLVTGATLKVQNAITKARSDNFNVDTHVQDVSQIVGDIGASAVQNENSQVARLFDSAFSGVNTKAITSAGEFVAKTRFGNLQENIANATSNGVSLVRRDPGSLDNVIATLDGVIGNSDSVTELGRKQLNKNITDQLVTSSVLGDLDSNNIQGAQQTLARTDLDGLSAQKRNQLQNLVNTAKNKRRVIADANLEKDVGLFKLNAPLSQNSTEQNIEKIRNFASRTIASCSGAVAVCSNKASKLVTDLSIVTRSEQYKALIYNETPQHSEALLGSLEDAFKDSFVDRTAINNAREVADKIDLLKDTKPIEALEQNPFYIRDQRLKQAEGSELDEENLDDIVARKIKIGSASTKLLSDSVADQFVNILNSGDNSELLKAVSRINKSGKHKPDILAQLQKAGGNLDNAYFAQFVNNDNIITPYLNTRLKQSVLSDLLVAKNTSFKDIKLSIGTRFGDFIDSEVSQGNTGTLHALTTFAAGLVTGVAQRKGIESVDDALDVIEEEIVGGQYNEINISGDTQFVRIGNGVQLTDQQKRELTTGMKVLAKQKASKHNNAVQENLTGRVSGSKIVYVIPKKTINGPQDLPTTIQYNTFEEAIKAGKKEIERLESSPGYTVALDNLLTKSPSETFPNLTAKIEETVNTVKEGVARVFGQSHDELTIPDNPTPEEKQTFKDVVTVSHANKTALENEYSKSFEVPKEDSVFSPIPKLAPASLVNITRDLIEQVHIPREVLDTTFQKEILDTSEIQGRFDKVKNSVVIDSFQGLRKELSAMEKYLAEINGVDSKQIESLPENKQQEIFKQGGKIVEGVTDKLLVKESIDFPKGSKVKDAVSTAVGKSVLINGSIPLVVGAKNGELSKKFLSDYKSLPKGLNTKVGLSGATVQEYLNKGLELTTGSSVSYSLFLNTLSAETSIGQKNTAQNVGEISSNAAKSVLLKGGSFTSFDSKHSITNIRQLDKYSKLLDTKNLTRTQKQTLDIFNKVLSSPSSVFKVLENKAQAINGPLSNLVQRIPEVERFKDSFVNAAYNGGESQANESIRRVLNVDDAFLTGLGGKDILDLTTNDMRFGALRRLTIKNLKSEGLTDSNGSGATVADVMVKDFSLNTGKLLPRDSNKFIQHLQNPSPRQIRLFTELTGKAEKDYFDISNKIVNEIQKLSNANTGVPVYIERTLPTDKQKDKGLVFNITPRDINLPSR